MAIQSPTVPATATPSTRRGLRSHGHPGLSLSWVINAYTLTFGGMLLLGARAGDILGPRRTFLSGIAVFTLASLGSAMFTIVASSTTISWQDRMRVNHILTTDRPETTGDMLGAEVTTCR